MHHNVFLFYFFLQVKKHKGNGGWGDKRDHALCRSFSVSTAPGQDILNSSVLTGLHMGNGLVRNNNNNNTAIQVGSWLLHFTFLYWLSSGFFPKIWIWLQWHHGCRFTSGFTYKHSMAVCISIEVAVLTPSYNPCLRSNFAKWFTSFSFSKITWSNKKKRKEKPSYA